MDLSNIPGWAWAIAAVVAYLKFFRKPSAPPAPTGPKVEGAIADTVAAIVAKHVPAWLRFIATPLANMIEALIVAKIGPLVNAEVHAVLSTREENARKAREALAPK